MLAAGVDREKNRVTQCSILVSLCVFGNITYKKLYTQMDYTTERKKTKNIHVYIYIQNEWLNVDVNIEKNEKYQIKKPFDSWSYKSDWTAKKTKNRCALYNIFLSYEHILDCDDDAHWSALNLSLINRIYK